MKTINTNKHPNQNTNPLQRPLRVLDASALSAVRGGISFTTKVNKSSPG